MDLNKMVSDAIARAERALADCRKKTEQELRQCRRVGATEWDDIK